MPGQPQYGKEGMGMSMASFFFYVQMGMFSAGGGYDTIALIQNQMAGLVDDTAGLQTNGKPKAEGKA